MLTAHNPSEKKESVSRKLIANTLFNVLGQAYTILLGLVVVPYVVHRLGAGLYGLIALVAALGSFAGLLNFGFGRAVSKYVSELYWAGDFQAINSLLRSALTVSFLAGGAGCVLLLSFQKPLVSGLIHGDQSAASYAGFAVLATALGVLISLPLDSISAVPIAVQRFDITNRINILLSTMKNAGAVAVLAAGLFFKAVLGVYIFASVLVFLAYVYYARKLLPGLSLRPSLNWRDIKRLARFSAPVLVGSASALVVHRLDRVLMAYFLPVAAVAFYVIPYSLAERTWMGVGNITSVIFPSASELSSQQDGGKVKELYVRASKMALLAAMPATLLLLGAPEQILHYWVGPEYALRGALALQFLAGGFLFNIAVHVPYVVAQGVDRPWISARYSLLNGIANLVLFLVLIPRFGILGAAAAFFVSEVAIAPLFIWEVNRAVGVPFQRLVREAYLRPLCCGIAWCLLLRAFASRASSLADVLLYGTLAVCGYGVLAFASAIERRERAVIFEQIVRLLGVNRSAVDGAAPS